MSFLVKIGEEDIYGTLTLGSFSVILSYSLSISTTPLLHIENVTVVFRLSEPYGWELFLRSVCTPETGVTLRRWEGPKFFFDD